jgi:hypothetical protein
MSEVDPETTSEIVIESHEESEEESQEEESQEESQEEAPETNETNPSTREVVQNVQDMLSSADGMVENSELEKRVKLLEIKIEKLLNSASMSRQARGVIDEYTV